MGALDKRPPTENESLSRMMDKSNWSSDYAEAPKHYADVKDQMFHDPVQLSLAETVAQLVHAHMPPK
jgi:hypothetical protein